MPEVTTTSPTTMSATSDTYSIRSRSSPPPTTTPCARERSISAPAAALRSMSSCTFAARALGTTTRPTTPPARSPPCRRAARRAVPLSIVSGPELGRRAGRDDLGGGRSSASTGRAARAAARGRASGRPARAAPAARSARSASCASQRLVLGSHLPQADVAAPDAAERRDAAEVAALHLGEDAEGHRFEHRHAAARIDLRGNQDDVSEHDAPGTGSRRAVE